MSGSSQRWQAVLQVETEGGGTQRWQQRPGYKLRRLSAVTTGLNTVSTPCSKRGMKGRVRGHSDQCVLAASPEAR